MAPTAYSQNLDSLTVLKISNLSLSFGEVPFLQNINLTFSSKSITAIMGPPGSGKTSLIRCLNRTSELLPKAKITGEIIFEDQNIISPDIDPNYVRRRIGMVFETPNLFPKSIYDNVAWAAKIHRPTENTDQIVEAALKDVYLWDELKDKLAYKPNFLSRGQQQRLCIARTLAVQPKILVLDEPTLELDPFSTSRIEDILDELKSRITIILSTRNSAQAGRISDYCVMLMNGKIAEQGTTDQLFYAPQSQITESFISGKMY